MNRCFTFVPFVLGLLYCALLVGCDSDSSTHFPAGYLPYTTYSNEVADFSIRFPKAWPRTYGTEGLTVQATSPKENDSDAYQETAGVIVVYMDYDRTLEDYHLRNKGALATVYNSYNFHISGEGDTRIGDRDAKVLEFTYTWNGTTVYNQEFEAVSGDRAYVVLCTSTADAFPRFRDIFAEIGHTLHISYTGHAVDDSASLKSRATISEGASPSVRAAQAAGSGASQP